MKRDRRLVREMALALTGVALLTAAFAAVVASLLAPWVGPAIDALAAALGVRVSPAARTGALLLVGGGVVLLTQFRYARRRLLASVDARPADPETDRDLLARVDRLAALANAAPPAVAVVETDTPNCFALGGPGGGTIVISEGLCDRLDGERLDAVLAHELAHLRNRDAAVLTLSSFLPVLVDDRAAGVSGLPAPVTWATVAVVGYPLARSVVDAPLFSPTYAAAYAVLVVAVVLLGGIALGVLVIPMAALSRRLARAREFAADRAGALLLGDPAALATALETLTEERRPERDARMEAVATLCLLPHGFGTEDPDSDAPAFVVETTAHPPVDERIQRLRDLTAELEGE